MRKRKDEQPNDYGYKKTDEELENLEGRLSSLYTDASKEMQAKLDTFMKGHNKLYNEKLKEMKDGVITEKEFQSWTQTHILQTKAMKAQIDSLTEDLVNTDKLAREMINGELPDIYVTNYNFEGYKVEKTAQASGIEYNSFTIYNSDAVARIAKKNPDLLPAVDPKKVDTIADRRWNKQKIGTVIQQGILQGKPIPDIAKGLREVTDMDEAASIRNARTALVGAQNAGRKDAADRVRESGVVEMVDVWSCTYDKRTRDTHIALDGQERGKDGYFTTFNGDKLEYPCDPNGVPAEVYNCRCRMNSYIKGIDHSKDKALYEEFMDEGGFEDWEHVKSQRDKKVADFEKNKEKVEEKLSAKDLLKDEPKQITYGGHIDDGISYKNRNYEFTEEGQEQIAEDLGVTKERAQEFEKAIDSYSAGGFRNIRAASCGQNDDPELKNKADAIEEFIDKSPKWDGGQLMRGIYVDNTDDLQALIDAGKSGDAIDMLGMSSWTSNKEVAESYARVKSAGGEGKNVILVTNSTSTDFGTSIKHLSRFRAEDEVMVSSKADFVPTKVIKKKKAVYIYGDLMEAEDE